MESSSFKPLITKKYNNQKYFFFFNTFCHEYCRKKLNKTCYNILLNINIICEKLINTKNKYNKWNDSNNNEI